MLAPAFRSWIICGTPQFCLKGPGNSGPCKSSDRASVQGSRPEISQARGPLQRELEHLACTGKKEEAGAVGGMFLLIVFLFSFFLSFFKY